MSNEVKTKETVDMDPKYIIKLTVTLFITCVPPPWKMSMRPRTAARPLAAL